MTPEERSLLEQTAALAKENNKILRSMRASARWTAFLRTAYWIVIIGASIAAYVYIKPYIETLEETYKDIKGGIEQANETVETVNGAVQKMK